ncbi:uncharacterized protein LOC108199256 [Daucus carota subsp. sativus]|uniref:uncharacterized protein LOC108199256 n=1 Tax=Daucus carota subsp. sativus TaxID=79200 RepID=UPI00308301E1
MANFGDEDNVDGLSDVDDEVPALAGVGRELPENAPMANFLELEAREVAETLKSERDEALREKKEALKAIEELSAELFEAKKVRDEAIRAKDCLRSEIETAAQMLVIGIDKISGKIINFSSFAATGLPRSQKYTGLQAVAYGVIKRTNEIVEELLRRIDLSSRSALEAREQMEQRSYEIAIEFSQLEATLGGLSRELAEKNSYVEKMENHVARKDKRISELERDVVERQTLADSEVADLRKVVDEFREQRSLMVHQSRYLPKIYDQLNEVIKIAGGDELVTSLFLTRETDMEGNICACLRGIELIYELSKTAVKSMRDLADERNLEVKRLNDAMSLLLKERDHIGGLLGSALSRMAPDLVCKTNELSKSEESLSGNVALEGVGAPLIMDKTVSQMAYSLEKISKQLELEMIELKHIVDKLREEKCLLTQQVESQAVELIIANKTSKKLKRKKEQRMKMLKGL